MSLWVYEGWATLPALPWLHQLWRVTISHTHIDSYCFYTELIISWPKQKPFSILHCHNNWTEHVYLGVWFVGRVEISGETETHFVHSQQSVYDLMDGDCFSNVTSDLLQYISNNKVIHKKKKKKKDWLFIGSFDQYITCTSFPSCNMVLCW